MDEVCCDSLIFTQISSVENEPPSGELTLILASGVSRLGSTVKPIATNTAMLNSQVDLRFTSAQLNVVSFAEIVPFAVKRAEITPLVYSTI